MKKYLIRLLPTVLLISFMSACAVQSKDDAPAYEKFRYNQEGYFTKGPKLALVSEDVDELVIRDEAGKEVLRAAAALPLFWDASGDAVRKVDFSELDSAGTYIVEPSGSDEKYKILIADNPFEELGKSVIKAFYYNRSSIPLEEKHAGKWTREAGHPDTLVLVHSSAADANRPEGTIISSPLGWYDAGDYNKYVVNSAITNYTLLRALSDYPEYYAALELNIPESGNGVPELLSEILFNLRWFISMQDDYDGGVYHKLTTKKFEEFVMPNEAVNQRFVVAKSTAATLDYAALTAAASRVLRKYEDLLPGLADTCLIRSEKAWNWALANPEIYYQQPADIATGAYGDNMLDDEWFWAASELYLATGDDKYREVIKMKYDAPTVPSWSDVRTLGFFSLLDNYDSIAVIAQSLPLEDEFMALADKLTLASQTSAYGLSIQKFEWGSNSSVANEGVIKLFAYKMTGDTKYLNSAVSDLDFILGRNATGYCFVTGFGVNQVMNIHHRPSAADGILEPVPGFLVGGPNLAVLDDCGADIERSPFPAKSYVDLECSYSTNEIAINWNAPMVYLVGAINARMR